MGEGGKTCLDKTEVFHLNLEFLENKVCLVFFSFTQKDIHVVTTVKSSEFEFSVKEMFTLKG